MAGLKAATMTTKRSGSPYDLVNIGNLLRRRAGSDCRRATIGLANELEKVKARLDELEEAHARIAELEAENIRLGIEYQRMRLALGDIAINSKRALKESPTDQLTAHSDIERQDDKWIPEVQE